MIQTSQQFVVEQPCIRLITRKQIIKNIDILFYIVIQIYLFYNQKKYHIMYFIDHFIL